jgi:hypothetical protein
LYFSIYLQIECNIQNTTKHRNTIRNTVNRLPTGTLNENQALLLFSLIFLLIEELPARTGLKISSIDFYLFSKHLNSLSKWTLGWRFTGPPLSSLIVDCHLRCCNLNAHGFVDMLVSNSLGSLVLSLETHNSTAFFPKWHSAGPRGYRKRKQ